jgi:hypothetical protein
MDMKNKLFALFVWLALIVSLTACSSSRGELGLSNLRMAFDEYGEDVTTTFSPSDVINAVVDLENVPQQTEVVAKWIAVDVEGEEPDLLFQEQSLEVDEDDFSGTIFFQLTNDGDWPTGMYKVELYLDGVLSQSVEFNVE